MATILKSSIPYKPPATENLIEFIRDGLQKNSNRTIVIDAVSGEQWTGKELASVVLNIAHYLTEECGLKKGDVCSLYGEENDKFAILLLAITCAGGVSNYLTHYYSGRELHDTTQILKCKLLFSHHRLLKKVQADLADIEDQLQIFSFDEPCTGFKGGCKTIGNLFSKATPPATSFEKLLEITKISPANDFAVIQFSTGTTGKPKPIPRTHKNLCHLAASVDHEELMDMRPGVVISGSLPITHRPGLWALLACINGGSAFVIWTNLSDVDDALATIEKYKVTIMSSSIPFLSMLGNVDDRIKDKHDVSSLKHIITSGAKIVNPELPKSVVERYSLKSLRQCFGMTESGWIFLIELSLAKDMYLSVGHVVPGTEVILIDREDNGKTLGPHERGEIALRGPQIFPGYLNPNQPGALNRSDFIEDGGWFKSGDQGYYDKNQFIFIEGRYKEMLLLKSGFRYFPDQIEATIMEHPAIAGACVVKVGQVDSYDIGRAYVTLKGGYNLTDKELLEFILEKSPAVVLDGGIRILEAFPRLQNGKVNKQALKSLP